jgi:hypothetical protein
VATQVGVSSSVPAKPRNPGQQDIIPAKHFGEYFGLDKILQLATNIQPGALAISSKKQASSKPTLSQVPSVPAVPSPPPNHFDKYVAERATAARATGSSSLSLTAFPDVPKSNVLLQPPVIPTTTLLIAYASIVCALVCLRTVATMILCHLQRHLICL